MLLDIYYNFSLQLQQQHTILFLLHAAFDVEFLSKRFFFYYYVEANYEHRNLREILDSGSLMLKHTDHSGCSLQCVNIHLILKT